MRLRFSLTINKQKFPLEMTARLLPSHKGQKKGRQKGTGKTNNRTDRKEIVPVFISQGSCQLPSLGPQLRVRLTLLVLAIILMDSLKERDLAFFCIQAKSAIRERFLHFTNGKSNNKISGVMKNCNIYYPNKSNLDLFGK